MSGKFGIPGGELIVLGESERKYYANSCPEFHSGHWNSCDRSFPKSEHSVHPSDRPAERHPTAGGDDFRRSLWYYNIILPTSCKYWTRRKRSLVRRKTRYKKFIATFSPGFRPHFYRKFFKQKLGDPICDQFCLERYTNRTLFAIADGCNWGPKPQTAAKIAAQTFVDFNKRVIFDPDMKTSNQMMRAFLNSFLQAHNKVKQLSKKIDFLRKKIS